MNKFIWVSRHPLNVEQKEDLQSRGITDTIEYGDIDAFDEGAIKNLFDYYHTVKECTDGNVVVGVVNAHLAARLVDHGIPVAVAENGKRQEEGKPPTFTHIRWHFTPKNVMKKGRCS